MIGSGLFRVMVWTLLLVAYLAHITFARSLFASVSFVAVLSVLALMLTDWGQVAASLAQLSASDAHHDSEVARAAVTLDFHQIQDEIARLADMQPGPEATALAAKLRATLGYEPVGETTDGGW